MDRVNGNDHFSNVKPGLIVGENVLFDEQVHEISSGNVVHDQIEVIVVLERALETDNPGVFV